MNRFAAVFVFVAVAACSDQGPPGPNLVVANESAATPVVVTLLDGLGDTVFSATLAIGARECRTLDVGGLVSGEVVAPDTTIAVAPFWAAETNTWSDKLLVRSGTSLIQTRGVRDGC